MLLGILSTPILYRWLGPSLYGEYATVLSAHAIFMIFISSGVADGVRKYIAEDRADDDWESYVIGFYLRLAAILAGIGAVILAGLAYVGFFEWVFGPAFTTYFYVMIAMIIAAQFWAFARKSLMGFGLEKYSEPLKVLYNVSFVGVALPLVYFDYGVVGALIGQIVGTAIAAVIGAVLVHRRESLYSAFRSPPRSFPKREMMTFNSLSVVLILCLMSLYHVDILMLQSLVNGEQVGHYKAALVFAEFLWFIPITLQTVFVHSTSELWSQGKVEKVTDLAARTTRYTFLLTAVMAIGMAALAGAVVPVYWGTGSEPVVDPLILLLPGAIGFALARPILAVSQGKGELKYPIAATATAAVINLVLNALLIPRYGMHGAAVATSIGYGSMVVFHVWSAWQVGFNPLSDARIPRIVATSVVASVPIFGMARLFSTVVSVPVIGEIPISTFLVPPLGLVAFLATAIVFHAVGLSELLKICTEFPDPIGSTARPLYRRVRDLNDSKLASFFRI